MMKITFLGTGTSTGVPEIGCQCEVCTSKDPRDSRLRTSALIETEGKRILIDCGPDFRQQMLINHIEEVDAVLITHEHYDHVGGLDDLRPVGREHGMKIYVEESVAEAIETRLPYAFGPKKYPGVPNFELLRITTEPFLAAGTPIIPIRLIHGTLPILGYRIGNMAYLTDLTSIPETEFEKLKNIDLLVIEALQRGMHPSHEGVEEALLNIHRIQPKRAYLTHMGHRIGLHANIEEELPPSIYFAYDGLSVEVM